MSDDRHCVRVDRVLQEDVDARGEDGRQADEEGKHENLGSSDVTLLSRVQTSSSQLESARTLDVSVHSRHALAKHLISMGLGPVVLSRLPLSFAPLK